MTAGQALEIWPVPGSTAAGQCPQCGDAGIVLAPCPNRACRTWGYRFLPAALAAKGAALRDVDTRRTIGTVIGGFVVLEFVGSGQFGRVFRAANDAGKRAALKLLHVPTSGSDDSGGTGKAPGSAEVAALRQTRDDNIVGYLADGLSDARPWLAMEYLANSRSLEDELRTRRATQGFTIAELRQIMAGVCKGLTAAHAVGIVHRDMKPANVMLCTQGGALVPKIVDFGLAKFVADGSRTRSLAGTPRYMAPEQLTGGRIGPWTDVYAVSCMFAELLTGERLLEGMTVEEIDRRKLQVDFNPIQDFRGLTADERAFLTRAAAHDPGLRVASAAELWNGMSVLLNARQRLGARATGGDYWQSRASYLERENQHLRSALASAKATSSTGAPPTDPTKHAGVAATGLIVSGTVLLVGIVLLVVWSYQRPVIPSAAPEGTDLGAAAPSPLVAMAPAPAPVTLLEPVTEPAAEPAPAKSRTEEVPSSTTERAPSPVRLPTRPRPTDAEKPRDLRWLARPDQTVLDTAANVVWQVDGSRYGLNWSEAQAYCRSLRLGGRSTWRLPSKAELATLIDASRPKGERIRPAFRNASAWYWTATPSADASRAWAVDFDLGDAVQHVVQAGNRVRCVSLP